MANKRERAENAKARRKFAALASMNRTIDAGGDEAAGVAKSKRKLNDTWSKRVSNNVRGFYSEKEARNGKA